MDSTVQLANLLLEQEQHAAALQARARTTINIPEAHYHRRMASANHLGE